MSPEPQTPQAETIPEPEEIVQARWCLGQVKEMIDAGEVESVFIYVHHREGGYRILQSRCPDKHTDAGILLEMAVMRLGFTDRPEVQDMLDQTH